MHAPESCCKAQSVTIRRDTKGPIIAILSPFASSYSVGSWVPALYGCIDLHSQSASCEGTVDFGHRINTKTPGLKSFSVEASDRADNVNRKTVAYKVK
jgi:hypothetical protein